MATPEIRAYLEAAAVLQAAYRRWRDYIEAGQPEVWDQLTVDPNHDLYEDCSLASKRAAEALDACMPARLRGFLVESTGGSPGFGGALADEYVYFPMLVEEIGDRAAAEKAWASGRRPRRYPTEMLDFAAIVDQL